MMRLQGRQTGNRTHGHSPIQHGRTRPTGTDASAGHLTGPTTGYDDSHRSDKASCSAVS